MATTAFNARKDRIRLQYGESPHTLDFDPDDISAASTTLSNSSTPRPKPYDDLPHDPAEGIPEEECWLFKPPKTTAQQSVLSYSSGLQWAREVFDSPLSTFYPRRLDLLHRLEVILATQPAKRFENLGGSVPALNISTDAKVAPTPLSRSKLIGGGSGQNFIAGTTATFTRPKRHTSEILPQHTRQGSSPSGNRSPSGSVKPSGSTDDLQNVADIQTMARKQADELKAEVAAISAHQHAARLGSSQQSLNSANPESPYSSQNRLNISSSSTASDIAKQQMAALRLSLDTSRQNYSGGSGDDVLEGGGEASIPFRPFPSPPPMPGTRFTFRQPPASSTTTPDAFVPPEGQQAVIVGRTTQISSRLPAPMRKPGFDKGPRFPSSEALPSYGWGDGVAPRKISKGRIPVPAPRSSHSNAPE